MTLKMSRPLVYVTAAAALVAVLVIARPALDSMAIQSSRRPIK